MCSPPPSTDGIGSLTPNARSFNHLPPFVNPLGANEHKHGSRLMDDVAMDRIGLHVSEALVAGISI